MDWRESRAGTNARGNIGIAVAANPPNVTPPVPALLIGREDDAHRIKQKLSTRNGGKSTVIRGWPGVGKTTLVASLASDPEILETFPDGVLWASVGEEPDPIHELAIWARALDAGPRPEQRLEDAMAHLRGLLRDKHVLLILDDVWNTDSALPFQVGGPKCSILITTRFNDVAHALADTADDIILLDRLGDDDGVRLLRQLSPRVVEDFPEGCHQLVSDLEGLPLALRVAGRLLEREAAAGLDVGELFSALRGSAAILQETAPADRFDPRMGTTPTVELLLRKSTDRLDPETRRHFAFLGGVAPKPATFSLGTMRAVWRIDDPRPVVRELVDRGLLEPIPSRGRFWLHAILVLHALALLDEM